MSHILAIDVGNSRLKWALVGTRGTLAQGAVPNAEIGSLAVRDWQSMARPARAIGVNVAGEAARVRVEGQLARWRLPVEWIVPSAQACGVRNGYASPALLGADRWASLVAARQRLLDSGPPRPAVVVNAGTAVTVDALDEQGVFRGGLILPNMRLMLRTLAENTSALKVPAGRYADFPVNTADALYTGALRAVCGAIELSRAKLPHEGRPAMCFLAGGAAADLAPHLTAPLELVDNLVLEGVLVLAEA
ncbi:MAG: type III pantothenate kinase [Betaproteobacteria bacterium]|jgi:type III pantothenate kinase|nr:type III pantothenate kinase [Betaproteobacteria bacterium]